MDENASKKGSRKRCRLKINGIININMTKVTTKATVEKLVRNAGKDVAQIVVTIPEALASTIPLGKVTLTVDTLQSSMFEETEATKKRKK